MGSLNGTSFAHFQFKINSLFVFLQLFFLQAGSLLAVGDADGGVRLVGGGMINNL